MIRLFRNLIPHKEWFIVWGSLLVRHKPEKQFKWVWFGEPFDITFDGIGPYSLTEADRVLARLKD